ncbi:glycoside hydrolase family 38 C-terminal domain-containing protein [uncultured Pseudokineococcus sp.]|uniref:alpha-mannosidase n=1 Tax=uncultured Pseudokineococcus sp. TaxID=1642928 RepID=UPI002603490D|nr:glycoside hydrolase family 38 C-terminal domain-containing protein [uncultured Pseudokineococcus sp.]
MHDDRDLLRRRVERTLAHRLRPAVHRVVGSLQVEAWHVEGGRGEPVPPSAALPGDGRRDDARYEPMAVGDAWGPAWGTSWLHVTGEVPAEAAGRRVELVIDLGWADHSPGFQAEGLVYRPDGSPVKGLNPRNGWVPVAEAAAGGERVDLFVEAAANPLVLDVDPFRPTTLGDRLTAPAEPLYRLARADVAVLETEVWELVADLEVLGGLLEELSDDDPRAWQLARALERSLDVLDLQDVPGSAAAARGQLADVLAAPATASAHRLSAVGHAHIDSAWLWPLRETIRKVARTTSNVVDLMDSPQGQDLVYAMSSAQQYAWIEEHRPEVFARVAEKVREGRFVPVGGMWVESDTNMPGSEAMARQLVHGKRYFLDRFGVDTQELWLPDSFGYSAALPQLVRLSGSRWFLTQKISWNTTNVFPHHTFWWEGIDGTRVFTHFPPVDTYNSEISAAELAHAQRNHRDKAGSNRSLVPFGWGDGGGGPTREMLQRARRTADLEGSPRVVVEAPSAFFSAAEEEYASGPVWVGELYLEMHRGTYTSQAGTKQGNRRSEHLLREAELWSAAAAVAGDLAYPYEDLDRLWKTVLLHQFHDILPGSSIAWVHREARETYAAVAEELEGLIAAALQALTGGPAAGSGSVVLNAAPHARGGAPALGGGPLGEPAEPAPVVVETGGGEHVLDNGRVRVVVDERGLLSSVRDLEADREVLAPGQAGALLQLHPDTPNAWDAWDLDAFYRNRVSDLTGTDSVELLPADHGAATVRVTRSFGASRVVQDLSLAPGAARVDVRCEVDWQEREKVLKLAFPLDVHTDRAAFETQFGHLQRPTHVNTTWDAARFEVCAHRFVHVAEPGYGVAVVNDSTYGHDVARHPREGGGTTSTVRLSLLRAPRFPDPDTDQGTHVLRASLVVGGVADAVREGYALNLPERRVPGSRVVEPVVRVEDESAPGAVVVEAVKLAEDRSGDVVVRVYEALGGRARARLVPGFAAAGAEEVDLLERPAPEDVRGALAGGALDERGGASLSLRPFQVVTLRLRRATP